MKIYKLATIQDLNYEKNMAKHYADILKKFNEALRIKKEKQQYLNTLVNQKIPTETKQFQQAQSSLIHSLSIVRDYIQKLKYLKQIMAVEANDYDNTDSLDLLEDNDLDEIQLPDGSVIQVPYNIPQEDDDYSNITRLNTGTTGQLIGDITSYDFDIQDEEEKYQLQDFHRKRKFN